MQTTLKSMISILSDISAFSGSRHRATGRFSGWSRNESYLQIWGKWKNHLPMLDLLELPDLHVQPEKKKRRYIIIHVHALEIHVLAYSIFVIVLFV